MKSLALTRWDSSWLEVPVNPEKIAGQVGRENKEDGSERGLCSVNIRDFLK